MEKDISVVEKDFEFQTKEWKIHRIAWFIMALFLIAGLSGLWGSGPLSHQKTTNEEFEISYERYARIQKDFLLTVRLHSQNPNPELSINSDYFERVKIMDILPRPVSVTTTPENIRFRFDASKKGTIIFYMNPQKMGNQHLRIQVNQKQEIIRQLIYF